MDVKRIEEYHASRVLPDKAFRSSCYAAHVSMYFDTLGNVLACCQNTKYPVGNVQTERLPDIWNGPKIKKLRTALEKDRFGAGCQFCEWQISVGNYVNAFTRNFDRFPVDSPSPDWPRMMEFSVSNTCNLECIMCIGTLSSSIRARREGLPPLPKAYSEQFFQDLRPFLKHLEFAKFLGGEPFLAAESFRIWDLMHEEKANILCNVTTNGTQWNERVEKVLERFPISICISMDGTTPQTVESIRVNAKFDLVHENFRRFHRYCRQRKTDITLTYCLMRQNWHEFGDYLLFADDWDCEVCVNLVREPAHCSLYTLPVEELSVIADELERLSPTYLPKLKKNRKVWIEQLTAIRRRVEHSSESSRSPFATPLALVVLDRNPALDHPDRMTFEKAKKRLIESVGSQTPIVLFSADQDDRVQSFESVDGTFFGVPAADSSGQPFEEIVRQMVDRRGLQRTVPIYRTAEYVDRAILFHRADGALDVLRVIAVPKLNEFGMPSGSVAAAAVTTLSADVFESQEEEIRRLFAEWGGSILRIDMDPEGRITSTRGDAEGGLGLLAKLQPGMNEAEFDRALVESWGQKQQLHDEVRPDREMISNCHVRANDTVVSRMITRPSFVGGKHVGYVREIAYTIVDPARAQAITESAKQTLADWSGKSGFVRLHHNRVDESTKFDGDVEVLLGMKPDSLVGLKGWELPDAFAKHFGQGRVFRWHLNGERLDMQVKVPIDAGFRIFRLIAVPTFNAGGHYQGRTRYITSWELRESRLDAAREHLRSSFADESKPVEWIELSFDQTDHCVGVAEPRPWLEIEPESWIGMPLDGLEGRLDHRLGNKQYGLWDEKPGRIEIDRVFELPGRSARVRSIEIPTIEADGRCAGTTVLLAGTMFDASTDWHRIHGEMLGVDQMLDRWKTTENVLSLGMDADGRVIRVRTGGGFCGLAESELLGMTIDDVRARIGFGPDSARRVWQAEPGNATDEVDEVLVPNASGGVTGRRLRRRHVPMYRTDLAVRAVDKLAIQEERYS